MSTLETMHVPPLPLQPSGVDWAACQVGNILADRATFQPKTFTPTGYLELDRAIGGGWAEAEVTVLFGQTNMGKSCLMANLALNAARVGAPSAILSLEMPSAEIAKLLVGIKTELPRLRIRHNDLNPEQSVLLAQGVRDIAQSPITILDREALSGPDMERLTAVIREGRQRFGHKIVLLDYLTKVGPFEEDDLKRIPALMAWATETARQNKLHMICLAQSNKASFARPAKATGQPVGLEDAKGSVELIADADNAMGVTRRDWGTLEPRDPSPMTCGVLKSRFGPGGAVYLKFHRSTGRIIEDPNPDSGEAPATRNTGAPMYSRAR